MCPNGTDLLSTGKIVSSHAAQGGSSEYICLVDVPEFLQTTPGLQDHRTQLYGTDYEFLATPPALGNLVRLNGPCSFCYAPTRNAKIILPGRISCPATWMREYYGYYMSEAIFSAHKTKAPICIDVDAEGIPGSEAFGAASTIHFMETTCNGISCPPYTDGGEITCAVCTK